MTLTHTVLSVDGNLAQVQFMNESNQIHIKELIIPSSANGDVNSQVFLDIVEDQKRSLEIKAQAQVITFITPS